MKRLIILPAALRDLRSISAYVAKDNPARARSFAAELRAKAEQTALRPRSFRQRQEIRPGLRSAVHGAYLLFFREQEEEVWVVRIVHGAQNLSKLSFD